jgi:hypothetical protein
MLVPCHCSTMAEETATDINNRSSNEFFVEILKHEMHEDRSIDINTVRSVPAPFDASVHICSPSVDADAVAKLRDFLASDPAASKAYKSALEKYPNANKWCSDAQLNRFLIARKFHIKDTASLLLGALEWRAMRQPESIETRKDFSLSFRQQASTGKIYIPGKDKWNRPVLVFDNTVENWPNLDDRMAHLAWNLEFAIRQMPNDVDKYVVILHLQNWSITNIPPFKVTIETIQMLTKCYPERLGHCVLYKPPGMFSAFWKTVKGFVDVKTQQKLVLISKDVSEGSKNDLTLKEIIGPDWKTLTGAEQPAFHPKSSPGFNIDTYWPMAMQKLKEIQARELLSS